MLEICYFIERREYTGESVWEGEKVLAARRDC